MGVSSQLKKRTILFSTAAERTAIWIENYPSQYSSEEWNYFDNEPFFSVLQQRVELFR
jgi:hypothetical protein